MPGPNNPEDGPKKIPGVYPSQDFRFLDFFVYLCYIEGTCRGSDKRSHLTVFASLHQECNIQRSIYSISIPLQPVFCHLRAHSGRYTLCSRYHASGIYCPLTHGPGMVGRRWVYHSHSRISLLGQLYSTPGPMGCPASFVARNPREGGRCMLPKEGLYSCLSAFHSVGIDPHLFQKAKDL